VYVDGKLLTTLRGDTIVRDFLGILEEYVATHYAPTTVVTA
jgi:(E)-4-hydroxy-3-methylbut-2-enyl-diphosphate synthase